MNYAAAQPRYLAAGWRGVLPLTPMTKWPPPKGWTGNDGRDPDDATLERWRTQEAASNLALRCPTGVVGVDVDDYGQKPGGATLAALEQRLGALPATWSSTSRPGTTSGIRFYRVPDDVRLDGVIGEGIEIVQRHHRYAVAWPSVHPEDRPYRWIRPSGEMAEVGAVPHVDELPNLPDTWIECFRVGREHGGDAGGFDWNEIRPSTPDRSPAVARTMASVVGVGAGGRHDAYRDAVAALLRLDAQGHPGAAEAVDDLGHDFVARVTADGSRTEPQARKEYADLVAGGRKLVGSTASKRPDWGDLERRPRVSLVHSNGDGPDHDDPATLLPPEFWDARPALAHIRQAAHARSRAADLLLHVVLARVAAMCPHTLELPPIVGTAGSLNYFANAIGRSGAGKSSGERIGRELIPSSVAPRAMLDGIPLGSGEGLAEAYMGVVEVDEGDGGGKSRKKKTERRQVRHNVYAYVDEGQSLVAQNQRKGSTIMDTLRSALSGSTLGQSNASADTTRVIPAGQYRLGLIVGFQPEKAELLLSDDAGGTPQRFQWCRATDPTIPDDAPDWPGPLDWRPPRGRLLDEHMVETGGWRRHQLSVATPIATEVRAADLARARGTAPDTDPLDAHGDLHRLKAAALLAILDGRLDVTVEDWELSTVLWDVSRAVRANTVAVIGYVRHREEEARLEAHRKRAEVAEEGRQQAASKVAGVADRLAAFVVDKDEGEGVARRDLLSRLASRERSHLDAAITHALEAGWMVEREGRFHRPTKPVEVVS